MDEDDAKFTQYSDFALEFSRTLCAGRWCIYLAQSRHACTNPCGRLKCNDRLLSKRCSAHTSASIPRKVWVGTFRGKTAPIFLFDLAVMVMDPMLIISLEESIM
jgi:hypothetical protein